MVTGEETPIRRHADGLDLFAQTVDRQSMDACQKSAVAPFDFRSGNRIAGSTKVFWRFARYEPAAKHDSFAFERLQRGVRLARRDRESLGDFRCRGWPAGFHQATDHGDASVDRRPIVSHGRGCFDGGLERSIRKNRADGRQTFRRNPSRPSVGQRQLGRSFVRRQFHKKGLPFARLVDRQQNTAEKQVMQLVRVAHERLRFADDLFDCTGIEPSQIADRFDRHHAWCRHCPRPALLNFTSIQERVRIGIEQFGRERRRLARVAGNVGDLAPLDLPQDFGEAVDIERLVQAVFHRLSGQRMVGQLDLAGGMLLAPGEPRKNGREQVIRAKSLERGGNLLGATPSQHLQRARDVPTPTDLEHRNSQHGLLQQLAQIVGLHNRKQAFDRKAVLRTNRQHVAVVVRGGLELKVERAAEAFPHGEAPRAVHRTAKGSVHDELHAACLVEKSLEDDATTGREQTECRLLRSRVGDNLTGHFFRATGFHDHPTFGLSRIVQPRLEIFAKPRDLPGKFQRTARRLAKPKRNGGRGTARVGHVHLPAADVQDLPRCIAQQEHIAPHALDGEVFVQRADHGFVRFRDHSIRADVGNRAGIGDRRQARPFASLDPLADVVVVEIDASTAGLACDAFRQVLDRAIKIGAGQTAIGIGSPDEREQIVDVPVLRGCLGNDLLGEHVERRLRNGDAVQHAATDRPQESQRFAQLIASERKQTPLGREAERVPGPANSLQKCGD